MLNTGTFLVNLLYWFLHKNSSFCIRTHCGAHWEQRPINYIYHYLIDATPFRPQGSSVSAVMNYAFNPEVRVGGVLHHSIYLLGMTPRCTDLHSLHFTRNPFTQLQQGAVKLLAPINCVSVNSLKSLSYQSCGKCPISSPSLPRLQQRSVTTMLSPLISPDNNQRDRASQMWRQNIFCLHLTGEVFHHCWRKQWWCQHRKAASRHNINC